MKFFFDLVVIIVGMPLLALVFLIVSLLTRVKIGTPIFFKQLRPGINGKEFTMVKFRTMTDLYDTEGCLLPDEERVTKFGQFLRSTSLDELPSLWNVLKGDMNLVGPRPLLVEYLSLYTDKQARRHEVKPGVTGWAQVNGRNAISWDEKFDLDVWYVDNQSVWLDIKILWLTVKKVIMRDGISAQGDVTMPVFKGSK
jgi:sugar transferase EpsL